MRIKLFAMTLFLLLPTVLLSTATLAEKITLVCGNKQDAYLTIDFDNRRVRYQSQGLFDESWDNVEITHDAVYFGNITLDLNSSIISNSNTGVQNFCYKLGRVR